MPHPPRAPIRGPNIRGAAIGAAAIGAATIGAATIRGAGIDARLPCPTMPVYAHHPKEVPHANQTDDP